MCVQHIPSLLYILLTDSAILRTFYSTCVGKVTLITACACM